MISYIFLHISAKYDDYYDNDDDDDDDDDVRTHMFSRWVWQSFWTDASRKQQKFLSTHNKYLNTIKKSFSQLFFPMLLLFLLFLLFLL